MCVVLRSHDRKECPAIAKLFGVHEIELLPGVSEADFERFVNAEFLPLSGMEGWTGYLAKGDRGERAGKYAVILEIESAAARDRYSPGTNEFSEEAQRALASLSAAMEKWVTFSQTVPGQNTVFTDYVVVDG
jgi:hypothetical protein